jgi:hypothetical protein
MLGIKVKEYMVLAESKAIVDVSSGICFLKLSEPSFT